MRVVSLLPAATEIVAAVGAGGFLVGVSHACDYPPDLVRGLPRVTRSRVDAALSSAAIDRMMVEAAHAGPPPIELDLAAVIALRPDLVIGQSICDVCAVGEGALAALAQALDPPPQLVTLHAHTLEGVFSDMLRVGAALGLTGDAEELVAGLRYRMRRVRPVRASGAAPPRTVVLEWLDPPYVAGHWVPELVDLAGGFDVGNRPGERSAPRSWSELVALGPDLVVVAPCGFDVPRARRELALITDRDARVLGTRRVEFLDGNAYTSRPGPRLAQAVELLARFVAG